MSRTRTPRRAAADTTGAVERHVDDPPGHDVDATASSAPTVGPGSPSSGSRGARLRSVVKRTALVVALVVLVALLGLAVWLAPLVLDREFPQAPAGAAPLEPTGHVHVGDAELPYVEQGSGPPVLLIHGSGDGLRTFEALSDMLADDQRVISYSRRGYEGAGAPATAWEQHHADAATVIEARTAEGAVVVGHSGGGIVATELALERPDLVAGLVLLEPGLYFEEHITLDAIRLMLAWQVRQLFMSDERAIVPFYRWVGSHDDGHRPWDSPDFPEDIKHRLVRSAPAVTADLELMQQAEEIPRERLGELTVPVTLLVGDRTLPVFAEITTTLEQLLPDSRTVVIPEAGHAMPRDNLPATADAIRDAGRVTVDGD